MQVPRQRQIKNHNNFLAVSKQQLSSQIFKSVRGIFKNSSNTGGKEKFNNHNNLSI